MKELLDRASANFDLLWASACIWLICASTFRYFWLKRRGVLFPIPKSDECIFSDHKASGRSLSSALARLSGASRVLSISITKEGFLYIRPHSIFALFTYNYELFHIIDLSKASVALSSGGSSYRLTGPCKICKVADFEICSSQRTALGKALLAGISISKSSSGILPNKSL